MYHYIWVRSFAFPFRLVSIFSMFKFDEAFYIYLSQGNHVETNSVSLRKKKHEHTQNSLYCKRKSIGRWCYFLNVRLFRVHDDRNIQYKILKESMNFHFEFEHILHGNRLS
jgi:hypothetical protein